jgi:hypothetical protein
MTEPAPAVVRTFSVAPAIPVRTGALSVGTAHRKLTRHRPGAPAPSPGHRQRRGGINGHGLPLAANNARISGAPPTAFHEPRRAAEAFLALRAPTA